MLSLPYYRLKLQVPQDLLYIYNDAVNKHNETTQSLFDSVNTNFNNNPENRQPINKHVDAGFDLFCPSELDVTSKTTIKVDQKVKGSMTFFTNSSACGIPVGYYMYPRSSTGTKTPLRLANSVGIIDSGYRGNYIAVFDNWSDSTYSIQNQQRLVQICPPNISFPFFIELVDNLDTNTQRGEGGFGSTGN